MSEVKQVIRHIMLYVAFSSFVILFEVGYHVIIKEPRPILDYIGHATFLCLALFVSDLVMAWWSKRRKK